VTFEDAVFRGSSAVVPLVSREGVTIDPGCDLSGDSFLPTQLTVDFTPIVQAYYGQQTRPLNQRNVDVQWEGEAWYFAVFQTAETGEMMPHPQVHPQPFGDCGDALRPTGPDSRFLGWGTHYQGEGRFNRSGEDVRWNFSCRIVRFDR
jgi:hypothetical protein